jgi:hypothetical protein
LISGASVSPAVTRPADQVNISITDLGLDYSVGFFLKKTSFLSVIGFNKNLIYQ